MRLGYFQLGSMGRLGNQLFQIFSTYGVAKYHNMDCHFNDVPVLKCLPTINYSLERFKPKTTLSEKSNITFTKFPKVHDMEISGYLQSYKYFNHLDDDCFKFQIKHKVGEENINVLEHDTSCFVHIRRGDYVRVSSNLLKPKWFLDAMEAMGEDKHFFVFSDDIIECMHIFKEDFKNYNVTYVVKGNEYQDLYAMSLIPNGIISNSSFSWWGAKLNNKPKRIIAPLCWFNPDEIDTEDLLYPEWEKL